MYKLTKNAILRISDGAIIQIGAINNDYVEYLDWVNAGNTPEPYVEIVDKITEVTMQQARLALLQSGKLPLVDTAIQSMTGMQGDAARITWQYSNTLKRNHPLVASMSGVLGLNESQIDSLFTLAASL
jgi:hypothetical protein